MGGVRMGPFGGLSTRAGAGGLVSLLLLAFALTSAAPAGAVTGGTQIPITDAPWQVEIASIGSNGLSYCGGAIISDRLVLTVAHCVTGSLDTALVAGDSDYKVEGPAQQSPKVKSMRMDPGFKAPGGSQPSADDIAVLELETPLVFGAGSVEPIALVASGSQWPDGTAVQVSGYGQHQVKPESTPNEALYSLNTALLDGAQCGGEAGAFLCTSTPGGTTCFGDSGSGLTVPGAPATLIGLVDRVEPSSGEECKLPSRDSYVNLAAPAIQQFIGTIPSSEGAVKPPSAPQQEATHGTRSAVRAAARKLSVSRGSAVVKLDCSGAARCRGKLTLTVLETVKVKGKRRKKTVTLGTASFTVTGGRAATIRVKLSSYGRAQVKATHGHVKASLTIAGIETEPAKRTESVTIA